MTMSRLSNRRMVDILIKKELRDIFRDKKSVLMMVIVPVVLYPLIFLVAFMIISMMQTGMKTQTYRIVVDGESTESVVSQLELDRDETGKKDDGYGLIFFEKNDYDMIAKEYIAGERDDGSGEPDAGGYEGEALIARIIKSELIDAYVKQTGKDYTVYYNSSVTNSSYAYGLISDAVEKLRLSLVQKSLDEKGLDSQSILNPVAMTGHDTATGEQSLGFFLGTIIPFMMIVSLLVGVFTPAVDTMTGEKERGTMETLLMMPVRASHIIVAKFVSVALVGLITTVLSIASMAGLGLYMLRLVSESGIQGIGSIDIGSFLPAIVITLPVLIVLSLFLTAVSMCVTCFAKSYKEANNYMSPVMIVVMLTGYIGFIPNIEFDRTMAMVPVANVCLLIKNILLFKVDISLVMIVILSTAVYTGLLVMLLGRMYKSEAVIFDEGISALSILERRSNMKPGGLPSHGDGWFVVLVGFILLAYVGGLLQLKLGLGGVVLSQFMLAGLALIMAVYTRKDIKRTFRFSVPGKNKDKKALTSWVGSLLVGVGMICICMVIGSIAVTLFPAEGQQVSDQLTSMFSGPGIILWLVVAVTPAICEELLFRGYVLSAFESRYPMWTAIVVSGALFGIYHMSFVRFFVTFIFGCALGYIAYTTGSIFPGMVLHALNNSLAVVSLLFPDFVVRYLPFLASDVLSLSTMMILAGVGLILVGIGNKLLKRY